jgi:hypothetical protein
MSVCYTDSIYYKYRPPPCPFFLPQNEGFMGLEQGQFAILSVDVNKNIRATVEIGVGLCHLSSQQ